MNKEENRIVPQLRFPEFERDKDWGEKTVNDIKSVVTDYVANGSFESLKKNLEVSDSIDYAYYVRLTDLRAGLGHTHQKYVSKKSYDFLTKSNLFGGELLMANIGANVGEVWKMPYANFPATLAPNMIMATFKENVEDEFVYYFFISELGKRNISITISGNAHPKINKTEFKQVKILVPTNPKEQQKIAACLSSLDEVITAETEKLDLLKDHKKGLLQQLFPAEGETQPKFRFPEFMDDGDWEETEIAELFKFKQGVQVPVDNQYPIKEDGMVRFIRIIDITGNSEPPRYIVNPGKDHIITKEDLFMIRYGTPGAISLGFDGVIANNLFRLIWKSNYSLNSLFWFYAFQKIEKKIFSLSGSSSMPAISFSTLNNLGITYPKKAKEQQKIAACLSAADELIDAQAKKIEALQEHKKGLLQQLFPTINN